MQIAIENPEQAERQLIALGLLRARPPASHASLKEKADYYSRKKEAKERGVLTSVIVDAMAQPTTKIPTKFPRRHELACKPKITLFVSVRVRMPEDSSWCVNTVVYRFPQDMWVRLITMMRPPGRWRHPHDEIDWSMSHEP